MGVAVSLPWSTSAAGIFISLWFVASLAVLDIGSVRRELMSAAGGLPILLWLLAALGTIWADVTWGERIAGLGGFDRLLCIPFTDRAISAIGARQLGAVWIFCIGAWRTATVLGFGDVSRPSLAGKMARSSGQGLHPSEHRIPNLPFVLLGSVLDDYRRQKWRTLLWSIALAALFFANIAFVVTGRTALLVFPVLVLLLGWRVSRWKGLLGAALSGCIIGMVAWLGSPYLRERLRDSLSELQTYHVSGASSSTGIHLEFLRKSMRFVATAPAIGHGTGSISEQFRNGAAASRPGSA